MSDIIYGKHNKLKFYTKSFTVNELLTTNKSLIRFGDGEIRIILMHQTSVFFQKLDKKLSERLKEIIIKYDNDRNMILCISDFANRSWFHEFVFENIDISKPLYDATFTSRMNSDDLQNISQIFVGKSLCYVGCLFDGSFRHDKIKILFESFPKSRRTNIRKISMDQFKHVSEKYTSQNILIDNILKSINYENIVNESIMSDDIKILKLLLVDNYKSNGYVNAYVHYYRDV